jgi:type II secretion system protein D
LKKLKIYVVIVLCLFFTLSFISTVLCQEVQRQGQPADYPDKTHLILAQVPSQPTTVPPQPKTPPKPQVLPQQAPQPAAPQPAAPQPAAPQPAAPQPAAQPQQSKSSPTVSFFFDDADIFEVAQTIFADVLKVNYIIDPRVKGRVNFRTVTPIPKDEVLSVMEIIFRLNGIGFVQEGGLYRIVPLTEVPQELLYSQIGKSPGQVAIEMFTFKNLDLKESMPDIENALGLHIKGGTVRILPLYRLNALIVIASSKVQLEYIKQWVETFDDMFAVARPKIFVYPLQNGKADHVAQILQSILGGGGGGSAPAPRITQPKPSTPKPGPSLQTPASSAPPTGVSVSVSGGGGFVSPLTKIFADDITNSLIILTTPADYKFLEETIKKIDVQPRQVVIEGLVAQVTLTDNLSFGFSWSLNTDVNISGLKPFTRPINLSGSASNNAADLGSVSATGFTFAATDPTGHLRALLQAALVNSNAKVLAAPHILVADNREAKIQIGSQVPLATSSTSYVPTTTTTAENLNAITSTVQYQDIGIILKVKPQINDSGLVSLELSQEVSSVGDNVKIGGQEYASINKTEATTNLVAKDGQTVIIGGLIREDVSKGKTGIPFLSKIPLLGWLFSDVTDKRARTELIILLTPHVVKNEEEAGNVTADYLNKFKGRISDKDINQFLEERGQTNQDNENKGSGGNKK